MRASLTPHAVANKVRMMRTQHKGTFAIVEGPSDKRTYRNLLHPDGCRIVIAHGKENAKTALQILEHDGVDGVLAIVDADFTHLEGGSTSCQNLLVTDLHDLECLMLTSPALVKLLSEYTESSRVQDFERRARCTITQALGDAAAIIGYLRWLSARNDLGLNFEGLAFSRFVTRDHLTVDLAKLIGEVRNRSQKHHLDESQIQRDLQVIRDPAHDPWQVCCGHDVVSILSFALRRTIASRKAADVEPARLEHDLRLAYEMSHFKETELCKSIEVWESTHPSYRVLPG